MTANPGSGWQHRVLGSISESDTANCQRNFKGDGLANDVELTLNVNNVFDVDPPEYRGDPAAGYYGFANGNTLGRLIQLGVSKKF